MLYHSTVINLDAERGNLDAQSRYIWCPPVLTRHILAERLLRNINYSLFAHLQEARLKNIFATIFPVRALSVNNVSWLSLSLRNNVY